MIRISVKSLIGGAPTTYINRKIITIFSVTFTQLPYVSGFPSNVNEQTKEISLLGDRLIRHFILSQFSVKLIDNTVKKMPSPHYSAYVF